MLPMLTHVYSWVAFTCAAVLPELPWSFAAGTVYWACWYFPPHFPRSTFTSASVWLLFVTLFEVFYVSFGQAIAAMVPSELLASILGKCYPRHARLNYFANVLSTYVFPVCDIILWCGGPLSGSSNILACLDVLVDSF